MLKKIATLPLLIAASSFASADTYRFDTNVSYSSSSIDFGLDSYDSNTLGVAGRAYFKEVDTSGHPLAEAAFLNHASSVGASYVESEVEDYESSATGVDVSLFIPETVLYLGVDYVDQEGDDDANVDLTAGIYKGNFLITTTYNEDIDYELNLAAKYVIVNGDGTALNLEAGFQKVDEGDDVLSVGADYYFTPAVSLGLTYVTADSDDVMSIRGQVFATESVYFAASYSDSDYADSYSLAAGVRF